jgi:hypothetical protein
VRELLERHVDSGFVPGVVAVLARQGEVHIEAMGNLAFEGAGSRTPMAGDTICRMGSMTKPIVAACAMTLVEDCTLRLDDPVDDLLPESGQANHHARDALGRVTHQRVPRRPALLPIARRTPQPTHFTSSVHAMTEVAGCSGYPATKGTLLSPTRHWPSTTPQLFASGLHVPDAQSRPRGRRPGPNSVAAVAAAVQPGTVRPAVEWAGCPTAKP